jgi:hypothetical protein
MIGVGYGPSKVEIDQAAGDLVLAGRDFFDKVERFYLFVTKAEANGYLSMIGYTTDMITFLNRCVNDLYTLKLVANGKATQAGLYDFWAAPDELAGVK